MRLKLLILSLFSCLILALYMFGLSSQSFNSVHSEPIEKTYELPNVLLIGDSIRMGYLPYVRKSLNGIANIYDIRENAKHSRYGAESIERWLSLAENWDIIHFNHGLHDLKYTSAPERKINQVPLVEYEKNLNSIIKRLKKENATLIFATTTPFLTPTNSFLNPDEVIRYNTVALRVMNEQSVAVNDLYRHILLDLEEMLIEKDIHFTPVGYKHIADKVANEIKATLVVRNHKSGQ